MSRRSSNEEVDAGSSPMTLDNLGEVQFRRNLTTDGAADLTQTNLSPTALDNLGVLFRSILEGEGAADLAQISANFSLSTEEKLISLIRSIAKEEAQLKIDSEGRVQIDYIADKKLLWDGSNANMIAEPKCDSQIQEKVDAYIKYIGYLQEEKPPAGVVLNKTKISLSQKKEYRDEYEFERTGRMLGKGNTAGDIEVVIDKKSKEKHAIKKMMISCFRQEEIKCWVDMSGTGYVPSLYLIRIENNKVVMHMEILKGKTLRSVINNMNGFFRDEMTRSLVKPFSLYILDRALEAVTQMHSQGWTHNDLHPGNLMIQKTDADGKVKVNVKLLDFGGAKILKDGNGSIEADIKGVLRIFMGVYTGQAFKDVVDLQENWMSEVKKFVVEMKKDDGEDLFRIMTVGMKVKKSSDVELHGFRNVDKDCLKKAMGDEQSEIMKNIEDVLFQEDCQLDSQVEQQDSIVTQLQNKLRAEIDRHQVTGRDLVHALYKISRYEETLQQLQADLERSQDNYRKALAQIPTPSYTADSRGIPEEQEAPQSFNLIPKQHLPVEEWEPGKNVFDAEVKPLQSANREKAPEQKIGKPPMDAKSKIGLELARYFELRQKQEVPKTETKMENTEPRKATGDPLFGSGDDDGGLKVRKPELVKKEVQAETVTEKPAKSFGPLAVQDNDDDDLFGGRKPKASKPIPTTPSYKAESSRGIPEEQEAPQSLSLMFSKPHLQVKEWEPGKNVFDADVKSLQSAKKEKAPEQNKWEPPKDTQSMIAQDFTERTQAGSKTETKNEKPASIKASGDQFFGGGGDEGVPAKKQEVKKPEPAKKEEKAETDTETPAKSPVPLDNDGDDLLGCGKPKANKPALVITDAVVKMSKTTLLTKETEPVETRLVVPADMKSLQIANKDRAKIQSKSIPPSSSSGSVTSPGADPSRAPPQITDETQRTTQPIEE